MSNHHIPSSIIYLHELDFVTILTRDTNALRYKGTSTPIVFIRAYISLRNVFIGIYNIRLLFLQNCSCYKNILFVTIDLSQLSCC